MRGVRDEVTLGVEGCLKAREQFVDGVGEVLQLIAWSWQGEALMEVVLGDPLRGHRDDPQGTQNASGDEPTKHD